MRKIGLIGGMSWISTERYYRYINQAVGRRAGGASSAPLIIESLDFAQIGRAQSAEDWARVSTLIVDSAVRLEAAGVTALAICANSVHKIYDDVAAKVQIPILHVADCVGAKMEADGIKSAALLGPRNVMTERWYRQRLVKHGVTLTPPDMERVEEIDRIIYEELTFGKATREAERTMRTFITNIDKMGVDAVILGATELAMVVDSRANIMPIYDSTDVHAAALVDWIFGEDK